MIHECLFYLWNCSNEDFLVNNEWTHLLELEEFLHPGEQKLLQTIIEIATDYHKLLAFNKKVLNQASDKKVVKDVSSSEITKVESTGRVPTGLYINAFCNGMHAVLEDYRKEMNRLEDMFLQNPQLSLTLILSSIEKYRNLFQDLLDTIQVIERDNLHGCVLMGRLHIYIKREVGQIALAAERIVQSINTIFYRHLCNWIIYGDLVETFGEFFIVDGEKPDENFFYADQMDKSLDSSENLILFKKCRIRRPPLVRKFYINWSMVPLFISEDTAESILFMGRIVWIIRNDPKKFCDDNYQVKYKRDIWEGKDIEYYRKIQDLESQTFDNNNFQIVIEECRIKLTKYLWSVMLDEGHLIEHLRLIRDYYALGRGELFQRFITVAENHLKDTSSESAVHNLNFIFMETARKIYGDNDKTYLKFELTTSNSDTTRTNPWARLQINFEIRWPLHIVFHPKVMELYNKLFCYLLRLKKTQIDLHKLWAEHVSKKQKIDRKVWTLRQKLIFLVNNLQYYLQVDVIEAQFSLLLKAVQNANEFEDIIKVHHEFISNLLAKTFVLIPDQEHTYKNKHRLYQIPAVQFDIPSKVYNVIIRLLELCDEFCLVATTWDAVLTEPELEELEIFQKRSDTVIESLLFILFSLHEKVRGEHLLQLLSQLDFNRYFSKNKPDYKSTAASQ